MSVGVSATKDVLLSKSYKKEKKMTGIADTKKNKCYCFCTNGQLGYLFTSICRRYKGNKESEWLGEH